MEIVPYPIRDRPQESMNEERYMVELTAGDVHLLHHCIEETIKNWPGSPARPVEEQEHLWYLRDSMYRMLLEYRFNHS